MCVYSFYLLTSELLGFILLPCSPSFSLRSVIVLTLTGLVLTAMVASLKRGSRFTHSPVRFTTASGSSISNFFDGLTPDAKVSARLSQVRATRPCGLSKPGISARIGSALGIGSTVHAQSNCIPVWCQGCYVGLFPTTCGAGCQGTYLGGITVGPEDMGLAQAGFSPCGSSTYCPCYIWGCPNSGNCGL